MLWHVRPCGNALDSDACRLHCLPSLLSNRSAGQMRRTIALHNHSRVGVLAFFYSLTIHSLDYGVLLRALQQPCTKLGCVKKTQHYTLMHVSEQRTCLKYLDLIRQAGRHTPTLRLISVSQLRKCNSVVTLFRRNRPDSVESRHQADVASGGANQM